MLGSFRLTVDWSDPVMFRVYNKGKLRMLFPKKYAFNSFVVAMNGWKTWKDLFGTYKRIK